MKSEKNAAKNRGKPINWLSLFSFIIVILMLIIGPSLISAKRNRDNRNDVKSGKVDQKEKTPPGEEDKNNPDKKSQKSKKKQDFFKLFRDKKSLRNKRKMGHRAWRGMMLTLWKDATPEEKVQLRKQWTKILGKPGRPGKYYKAQGNDPNNVNPDNPYLKKSKKSLKKDKMNHDEWFQQMMMYWEKKTPSPAQQNQIQKHWSYLKKRRSKKLRDDRDKGHGNDPGYFDPDNPGQGKGNIKQNKPQKYPNKGKGNK